MRARSQGLLTVELFANLEPATAKRALAGLPAVQLRCDQELDLSRTAAGCCLVRTGRIALEFVAAGQRRRTIGLIEEGDLLVPPVDLWDANGPRALCRAVEASQVLIVDRERLGTWLQEPALAANLVEVLAAQVAERELAVAIALEPLVERRVLLKLRQLADRWGRVTPDGVRLDLRLTHEELARMVGAVRESVTLALGRLSESGEVEIRNRTVLIRNPSPDAASDV